MMPLFGSITSYEKAGAVISAPAFFYYPIDRTTQKVHYQY